MKNYHYKKNMKQLLILIILLFFQLPSIGIVLNGDISYNYENTEIVDFETIRLHLIDEKHQENLNNIYLGNLEVNDRILAKFSDGSYGVSYKDNPTYSWYYSSNGRLINFTHKSSASYPCKTTKYKPDGTIIYTGKLISERESVLYTKDGKLIAHWIGNNCYDSENNIIMTRKYETNY